MKDTSRSLCYPVFVVIVFHLVKQSAKPLVFFFKFVANMGPYGSKNFKTLLTLQIAAESDQASPEFSFQLSSQRYCWSLEIRRIKILAQFFNFSYIINSGPYWSENFKTLLLLQFSFELCQTSPEFSSQWSSQKHCVGFF